MDNKYSLNLEKVLLERNINGYDNMIGYAITNLEKFPSVSLRQNDKRLEYDITYHYAYNTWIATDKLKELEKITKSACKIVYFTHNGPIIRWEL